MRLIQSRLGQSHSQEGHIELDPVEADQQRPLLNIGWEVLQIDALDENRRLAARDGADHRNIVLLGR
ncbi:MAG TPA: hypothetical protein VMY42_20870 [Thermoguttaceae bacterium]|nr:hypothetical protein [Thermoguttaceae bacterium]